MKAKVHYRRFTEENDWEGETWHFFIPAAGNREAIERLADLIEAYPNLGFTLPRHQLWSKRDVDVLVKNAAAGYLPSHTRLEGQLVLPRRLPATDEAVAELLGKGRIEKLVK